MFRKILPGIQNLPVEEIVMSQTTLADLQSDIQPLPMQNIAMSMETVAGFESMQRVAKLFSKSSIAPKAYQGNVADCFIAVDMAMRMGANPLMVMQNLYIVHGSPAWSAQFLIATFNKSGRFSAIRYEFQGVEGKDDWGCRAVTTELATREKLVGPLITIGLAKKEGWHSKPGSKWQTMPEQMLRYRAAAWLVRAYAPEIAMGLHTADELEDRTIKLMIYLIIGSVCNIFPETVIAVLVMAVLRILTGGYHSQSDLGCLILTGSMIFIPIILSKYAFISHMHFIVFSLGITVIYILYAPCGGKYSNVKGLALLWIKTVVTLILFCGYLGGIFINRRWGIIVILVSLMQGLSLIKMKRRISDE